jgi:RND family efflux transporter MFP subunit
MMDAQLITKEQLEHARYKLVASQFEVQREKENARNAQATARSFELELEKTRIVAPFDGIVARRYVRLGQKVAKDDKLFWISGSGPMRVRFTLPEKYLGMVKKGDALTVTSAAAPEQKHSAVVTTISPVVDPASGTIEVQAQLAGASADLLPGMTVDVHLR